MIDLDAVIAAEVRGDPIEVKVGGKKFKLKPVMPWEAPVLIGENNARDALACLTVNGDGPAFAEAVLADGPTLLEIASRMNAIYAVVEQGSEGKSSASPRSSARGGARSRPTSKRTTSSTRAKS